MLSPLEARYRAVFDAYDLVFQNPGLPGKTAVIGILLARAITSPRAERDTGWTRVCQSVVAHRAGVNPDRVGLVVKAMMGDRIIAKHAERIVRGDEIRVAVWLRSLVGPELLAILRALGGWSPDWRLYLPPTRAAPTCCPACKSARLRVVCKGCGYIVFGPDDTS